MNDVQPRKRKTSTPKRRRPPRGWPEFVRGADRRMSSVLGERDWWPATRDQWFRDEVIVGAVLTQNTAWRNVKRAIAALRDWGGDDGSGVSLRSISAMRREELIAAIRPVGYFNLKAKRLNAVVDWFGDACDFDLDRLAAKPTEEFRAELLEVHGVGPETADSILLYAFDRPVFVMDAYTRRILKWHGWAKGDESYAELRARYESNLVSDGAPTPEELVARYNQYHALLDNVAGRYCDTKAPNCSACPLNDRQWYATEVAWRRAQKAALPPSDGTE